MQSALLEAMQEHQVTIGGKTFALPNPFLVMATQNPIEQEGTYQLPSTGRPFYVESCHLAILLEEEKLIIRENIKGGLPTVDPSYNSCRDTKAREVVNQGIY